MPIPALTPTPPSAQPAATHAELAERRRRQELAHELAELSVDLARTAAVEAKQNPTPAALTAFERVARGARRALLLAQKLAEAPRPPTRAEARQEIARHVANRMAAGAGPRLEHSQPEHLPAEHLPAEHLSAELAERLDRLDDEDLLRRPAHEIADALCADLGLPQTPGLPTPERLPGTRVPRWQDGGWQDGGWQDGGWQDGGWSAVERVEPSPAPHGAAPAPGTPAWDASRPKLE